MEGQSSLRKQAKFSQRILCSSLRILQSPLPNEQTATILWSQNVSNNRPVCQYGGCSEFYNLF